MLRFDFYTKNQIEGKIMAYNKTSEERKRQAKKLYFYSYDPMIYVSDAHPIEVIED